MRTTPRSVALLLAAVLLSLLGPSVSAQATSDRLFLWKVRSNDNHVYLLGSIHVGNESFYPMPAEIEKAFADCKVLAVEVDLTKVDQAAVQETLLARGVYEGNDTLANHVPDQTLKNVRAYFADKGLPPEAMEKFKPWALSVTITMLEMQALGYKSELGIDKHFMERANGKRVIELESADEQVKLLSGFPDKLEAEFLASTLESVDQAEGLMQGTVASWKTGDAATLERLLITGPLGNRPALKEVFEKLFDERNEKMARKIEAFIKSKEPHFVVVGAGHLVGKNGILKLLEKQGFYVEQVARGAAAARPAEVAATDARPSDAKAADSKAAEGEKKPVKRGYAPADAWKK